MTPEPFDTAAWHHGSTPFTRDAAYSLRVAAGATPESRSPLLVGLHGMGMTPRSFARWVDPIAVEPWSILLPEGPFPLELRSGDSMRIGYSWYMYKGDEDDWRRWLDATEAHLLRLLDHVTVDSRIDRDRIVLLGFSQGCYLGYSLALRNPDRFAGLIAAGGRLKRAFVAPWLARARDLPVLIVHGVDDEAVPFASARESEATLREADFDVETAFTPTGHRIEHEQINAIRTWLRKHFDSNADS